MKLKSDGGAISAEEVYYKKELTNKHGGVIKVGDFVYGDTDDSGHPYCAELKTGKVKWKRKEQGEGRRSAAVTYADGRLYFHYQNGYGALVKAIANDYEEVGGFEPPKLNGESWAHPVISDGRLYLREGDLLYCYDVREEVGTERKTASVPLAVSRRSSPMLNRRLFLGLGSLALADVLRSARPSRVPRATRL